MSIVRSVVALVSSAMLLGATAPPRLAYPPAPAQPATDTYFGTQIVDPYRSLENPNDPRTRAWAAAETELAQRLIHGQPAYGQIQARVAALAQGSPSRSGLQIAAGRWVYLRRTPPAPQAALVVRNGGEGGAERVLYDPAASAVGAPPAIGSVYLSPDGSRVAFTTQQGGSEDETLHVVDVASGTMLGDTLPHVGGGTTPVALAWDADGKGFVHTALPRNADGTYAKDGIVLVHHVLGSDPASDAYVFGRGLSPKAEYHLLASRDGTALAAVEADGDGLPASVYVRRGNGAFVQVATPAAGIGNSAAAKAAFVGNVLAVVANGKASRGAVIGIGPGQTVDTGKTLVPGGALVIDDVVAAPGGFATLDVNGGDSGMRTFAADGTPRATVPIPDVATIDFAAADPNGGEVIVGVEGYTAPPRWFRYDAARNVLTPTSVAQSAPGDFSQVRVQRVFVPSLDGRVKIPLEIVSGPGTRGARTPTILTAYGAYGTMTRPRFSGSSLAWLERGGAIASAMIRGGGEYGEEWHTAARLATKTVSADDLAACAKWLGANGYGDAKHLGIMGGSAGGFLMGLALTRNPELYRAVVSSVGIYDLLRVELTPNGAFNTPEFGTVTDPAQFAWMRQQSPYLNVRKGVAYPAVLMTTGENDPRVDPYNSRKMVALLQADSSSPYPVLLLQKSGQGHGIGNSLQQRVEADAERYAFFWSQLSS
ncbi:MAG TPA: prolyl oligopeptidase family serine peptidase [Candidatus Elarobacter sp.]|jgi:prolyl oligopeptidase|nr:prolyl oligopeptidase family serine peptidase [Candidatus Elarobacter sp.]